MEVPFSRRVVVVRAFYSRPAYTGRIVVTAAEPKHPVASAARQTSLEAPLELCLPPEWVVSDASFDALFDLNPELRFELDETGRLIVMGFPGWMSSRRSTSIGIQVGVWAQHIGGEVVVADAEVRVGDVGRRLPDVAWLSPERAAALPPDYEGPLPFTPDFVVEVVSQSDRRSQQEAKMRMWIEHGVRLAWLIDPFEAVADIYREDGSREQLARPATLSGEDVLPGLVVDLSEIWRAEGA